jgi:hypothetical protein
MKNGRPSLRGARLYSFRFVWCLVGAFRKSLGILAQEIERGGFLG